MHGRVGYMDSIRLVTVAHDKNAVHNAVTDFKSVFYYTLYTDIEVIDKYEMKNIEVIDKYKMKS